MVKAAAMTMPSPDSHQLALAKRILLVVPTLDEAATIEACLASLLPNSPELMAAECLIVDGGSRDGTQEIISRLAAQDARIHLIENPHGEQASAVNIGAQRGGPERDILIRCDAHALYPKNFVLSVARQLIETGADSVVVPMDASPREGGPAFAEANAFIVDTPLGSGGAAHRGGHQAGWIDHGHHAAFVRSRFLSLGGYDPTMVGNEDAEYDTRLTKAGGRIWIEPSIRIKYFPRETARSLFRQYRRYGAARARHLRAHRKWPKLRQLAPVLHVTLLALSLTLLGLTPWALVYPAAYGLLLGGVAGYAVIRTGRPAMAQSAIALATMHLAWGIGFISELFRQRSIKP